MQIFNGEKPANTPPIRVDIVPGTKQRYSGGGVSLYEAKPTFQGGTATKRGILVQFMVEATSLCLVGGVAGIAAGTGAATAFRRFFGWDTAVFESFLNQCIRANVDCGTNPTLA